MANPINLLNDNVDLPPSQVFEAKVSVAPEAEGDDAYVIIDDIDANSLSEPCNWKPEIKKDGLYFPKVNDRCLVVFPASGDPWIVQFWISAAEPDIPVIGKEGAAGKDGAVGAAGKNGQNALQVRAASAAALATHMRSGNKLTASAVGLIGMFDGVAPLVGDRVLYKDATSALENGPYNVLSVGGTIAQMLAYMQMRDVLLREKETTPEPTSWIKRPGTKEQGTIATTGWRPIEAFGAGVELTNAAGTLYIAQKYGGLLGAGSIADIVANPGASRWYSVWACANKEVQSGYRIKAVNTSGTLHTVFLEKWVEGVKTQLAETVGVELKAGGSFGLSVKGGVVTAWKKKEAASVIEKISEAADGTFVEGYGGFDGCGNGASLKNFRAMTLQSSEKWELERTTDELVPGLVLMVSEGIVYGNVEFSLMNAAPIIPNLTALTFGFAGSGWTAIPFENTWANYEASGAYDMGFYRKGRDNRVQLKGLIKHATATGASVIFTLPVGYRPTRNLIFLAHAAVGASIAAFRLDVNSNGQVIAQVPAEATVYLSLSGVTFYAEQ